MPAAVELVVGDVGLAGEAGPRPGLGLRRRAGRRCAFAWLTRASPVGSTASSASSRSRSTAPSVASRTSTRQRRSTSSAMPAGRSATAGPHVERVDVGGRGQDGAERRELPPRAGLGRGRPSRPPPRARGRAASGPASGTTEPSNQCIVRRSESSVSSTGRLATATSSTSAGSSGAVVVAAAQVVPDAGPEQVVLDVRQQVDQGPDRGRVGDRGDPALGVRVEDDRAALGQAGRTRSPGSRAPGCGRSTRRRRRPPPGWCAAGRPGGPPAAYGARPPRPGRATACPGPRSAASWW